MPPDFIGPDQDAVPNNCRHPSTDRFVDFKRGNLKNECRCNRTNIGVSSGQNEQDARSLNTASEGTKEKNQIN
jgi:hypothetical protein